MQDGFLVDYLGGTGVDDITRLNSTFDGAVLNANPYEFSPLSADAYPLGSTENAIPRRVIVGKLFFFDENFTLRKADEEDYRKITEIVSVFKLFKELEEDDPLWRVMWESYTRGHGVDATQFKDLHWFDENVKNSTKEGRLSDLEKLGYIGGAFRCGETYAIVLDEKDFDILRHEVQHALDDSDDLERYGSSCDGDVYNVRQGNTFYHEVRGRIVEKQTQKETLFKTIKDTWNMYCELCDEDTYCPPHLEEKFKDLAKHISDNKPRTTKTKRRRTH